MYAASICLYAYICFQMLVNTNLTQLGVDLIHFSNESVPLYGQSAPEISLNDQSEMYT